jgi:hypothetical protein
MIANGLPAVVSPALLAATSAASTRSDSAQLPEPAFLARARELTGPAAGVAGIYESYEQLARRGWLLTSAAVATIARASRATDAGAAGAGAAAASAAVSGATASAHQAQASFARANSPLYIDAVYDGHFNLSLLGKSLVAGYEKLGGSSAFGATLTPGEIGALAAAYSIPGVRLEPHPGKALEHG